ncbi:2-keto-4-pentenoate hydratase [Geodermatophilus chilensis]|uniref:2-keto-4-pentenoate hydratase n=1 Tax=Geodermatophilus chilensis TaxID=2035835 RepID=UPI0018E49EB3|nr:fumarylacetoacetate hydrolase family protein [Geodermatophilus chilensis]
MIDGALVQWLADELAAAAAQARPVAPLTARAPGLDLTGAYAVQRALVRRWTDAGDRVVGHKVGLTSAAMQQQLGVDQPDSGVLLDRMVRTDGAILDAGRLIAPRVEAELALVLGADVPAGATRDQAAAAIASVAVAVEVIDSRIADWRIAVEDTVADNASSAYAVVGWPVPVEDVGDLRTVGLVLHRNGDVAATGAGAAVLGDPVLALTWLARRLAEPGKRLQAGQVVLPGAVHAAVPLAAGDVVTATGSGLGSVSLRMAAA